MTALIPYQRTFGDESGNLGESPPFALSVNILLYYGTEFDNILKSFEKMQLQSGHIFGPHFFSSLVA